MAIVAGVPARPDGVELIGEMVDSGYRNPPSLVRRTDGQTLQLTPLLYAVLEAVDGRRGYAEIAEVVSARTGRPIAASDVETLVERQLRPKGLLLQADGSAPALQRANPLTGLRLKLAVTDPAWTRRLTDPFTVLFHWWVWVPIVLAFGWVAWWLLVDRGLASATYQAFAAPNLLALVLIVTVLSAGFHEFGHAAAARRGGGQPGVMGAGWYLLWPAFYTDVTDTYRLDRGARVRTDLGGLYFNAIVAVLIAGAWMVTKWDALLLVIAAQMLQMIRQLTPLVRFDGYHVLADVTGVPDLFSRIGPILMSLWPTRWGDPRVAELKWWTRAVVTAWVLIVVPALLLVIAIMVFAAPRLIATAWSGIVREWGQAALHWEAGRYLDAVGAGLAMAIISLPLIAMGFIFGRLILSVARRIWGWAAGRPLRRALAGALALTMIAAVALAWWPSPERYQPVRPYEGGTLLDVANAPMAAAGYRPSSAQAADGGEVLTGLPTSGSLPTEADPQLALVLIPTEAGSGPIEPAWVFPFNEPLPPEEGDNQAFAMNTTDGSTTYKVAFAMVWVTDDEPVLNTNEAYAFSSCTDCTTVAVAFQVVLIAGRADVIVPQNLSAALNYECYECVTAAIADQLVLTIDSLPGVEEQIALRDVWVEITAFAETLPTLPLSEVISRLDGYKERIVTILGVAPLSESATPAPSRSPSAAGAGADSSESPEASSRATPRPTSSAGSQTPRPTPSSTPQSTPQPSSSPAPTPAN